MASKPKTWDEAPEHMKRRAYFLGLRCPDCGTNKDIIDNGEKDPALRAYQHAPTSECEGLSWDASEYDDTEVRQ